MAFQQRRPFSSFASSSMVPANQGKKVPTYGYNKPEHFMIWQTEERKAQILQAEVEREAGYNKEYYPDLKQNLSLKEAIAQASSGKIPPINAGFVCFYHYMEGNSLREVLLVNPAGDSESLELPELMFVRVSPYCPATLQQLQEHVLTLFQLGSTLPKHQHAVLAVSWTYASVVLPV